MKWKAYLKSSVKIKFCGSPWVLSTLGCWSSVFSVFANEDLALLVFGEGQFSLEIPHPRVSLEAEGLRVSPVEPGKRGTSRSPSWLVNGFVQGILIHGALGSSFFEMELLVTIVFNYSLMIWLLCCRARSTKTGTTSVSFSIASTELAQSQH